MSGKLSAGIHPSVGEGLWYELTSPWIPELAHPSNMLTLVALGGSLWSPENPYCQRWPTPVASSGFCGPKFPSAPISLGSRWVLVKLIYQPSPVPGPLLQFQPLDPLQLLADPHKPNLYAGSTSKLALVPSQPLWPLPPGWLAKNQALWLSQY